MGTGFGRRTQSAQARALALPQLGWTAAGAIALLFSGVAWASLPRPNDVRIAERLQWQALAIAPLAKGGKSGMRMDATAAVEPVDVVPVRKPQPAAEVRPEPIRVTPGPLRIRGRVGDGLYWSLRAAGASPQAAAQYLAALATEIDVGGDVSPGDRFDLVLAAGGTLQYAGLDRIAADDLQLIRWTAGGRDQWIDAARAERPEPVSTGLAWPVAGRITSYFGYRVHPILRFTRFHAGLDFGASWGSPIVATADGQVVGAGWAGGYGRQVRIAHGDGILTTYSHMSQIAAEPGSHVRQGQVIGYVGSSGFSTGPHLHYEVRRYGQPVNPLAVRFTGAPVVDTRLADAVKARLKALLATGSARG